MWRSARRSSGGVVVAARVAQVLLSTGIRRAAVAATSAGTPSGSLSGDVEQTVGRTVRAYGSGALRPLCSALTGLRACIYDGNFYIYADGTNYQDGTERGLDRDADGAPLSKTGPRGRATSERLRGMAHDGAGGVRELSLRDPPRHARRGARPRPAHAHAPRRPRAYRARIITACS